MWIRKADLEGGAGLLLYLLQSKAGFVPNLWEFLLDSQPTEGLLQAKTDFPREGNFIFMANPQTHAPSPNSALLGP